MKKYLMFMLAIAVSAVSCARESPEEVAAVTKTVRAYNIALIEAYKDADINYMLPFASEDQLSKLFPVLQALTVTGNSMIAIQDKFAIKRTKVGNDDAFVDTEEKWTYWWQDKFTGEVTKPKQVLDYKIRYHLIKTGGRWVVDRLEQK